MTFTLCVVSQMWLYLELNLICHSTYWSRLGFTKGIFRNGLYTRHAKRSGFFALLLNIKSCAVAIGKYYGLSFVFYHTFGWIYGPCGNLKLSIDVLEPIWYTFANFLVCVVAKLRKSVLYESDLEGRVEVWWLPGISVNFAQVEAFKHDRL